MRIDEQLLIDVFNIPRARAARWADPLDAACKHYRIDAPVQIAAFLAQIGHESGRLRYVREIWGPTPTQQRYEGRSDLGNTQPGDGSKFRGRGLIQVTGRANYSKCAAALGLPLLDYPELLEHPTNAAMSAAWFWDEHHINELADGHNIRGITRIINGGYNGLAEREELFACACVALEV